MGAKPVDFTPLSTKIEDRIIRDNVFKNQLYQYMAVSM